MYVTIGKKNPKTDLIDALLECHERIRTFIDVAQRIAASPNAPPEEIREAATRVRRYFDEALPRHVADEEQSILPRLAGKDPELDRALAQMHAEHHEHERPLSRLLSLMRELERAPERANDLSAELGRISSELAAALGEHLANEEAIVFPAIRERLSEEDRRAISAELRQRRV